jgi:hypothetical protein
MKGERTLRKTYIFIVLMCIVMLLPACGMLMQKKVRHMEAVQKTPVNCETAEADLKVLGDEKQNIAQQAAAGVTSIMPAGLVLGILTGTEDDKVKITIGYYDKMVDTRIAKIKSECNVE